MRSQRAVGIRSQRSSIALANDSLNPTAAANLRGRLGHTQTLLFGKFGRAVLNR